MKRLALRILMLFAANLAFASFAEASDDFYGGKQLTFLVGYTTGTGYDSYMRLVARHIGQHIPGNPTVVPQNMPGAGSLVMMNYIYNVASHDGTVIGLSPADPLLEPLYGDTNAKFDAQKFGWIGSPTRDPVSTCATWHSSPVKTLDDAKKNQVLVAALGPSTTTDLYPRVLNATIGTKFKILLGYPDSGSAGLAMERGEVDGICGLSTSNIRGTHPEWLDRHLLNLLAVFSARRSPDYPDVKTVYEYAADEQTRRVLDLAFSSNSIDRPIMAPPDLPQQRLATLREAFEATVKDPAYLADAKASNLDVNAVDGAAIEKLLTQLYGMPKAVVEKLESIRTAR